MGGPRGDPQKSSLPTGFFRGQGGIGRLGEFAPKTIGRLGEFAGQGIGRLGESVSEDLGNWYRKTWGVWGGGIGRLGELVSEDLGSSIGRLGAFWGAACVLHGEKPGPGGLLVVDQQYVLRVKAFKRNQQQSREIWTFNIKQGFPGFHMARRLTPQEAEAPVRLLPAEQEGCPFPGKSRKRTAPRGEGSLSCPTPSG